MKNKRNIFLVLFAVILLLLLLLFLKSKNNNIEKQLLNNNFIGSKDEYGYVEKNLYTKDIGDITIINFYDNIMYSRQEDMMEKSRRTQYIAIIALVIGIILISLKKEN